MDKPYLDFIATEECKELVSSGTQLVLRFPIKELPKYPSRLRAKPRARERALRAREARIQRQI